MAFGASNDFQLAHPSPPFRRTAQRNVSKAGRVASVGMGSALALWALRKGGVAGLAAGALGAALVARGVTGQDPILTASAPEQAIARARKWNGAALAARTVTINRPRQEVYAFWRQVENLEKVMSDVQRVEVIDERRSRWTIKGPLGAPVTFESIITTDEPGERINWESAPDAVVKNAGWVIFADAPEGRGTILRALVAYEPPGGPLGRLAAKALRKEPAIQARRELRRLKQLLETGEIATSKPGPAAPRSA